MKYKTHNNGSEQSTATPTLPPRWTPTPSERLAYNLQEAAAVLGISYVSVFRLVQRGKLHSVRALRHHLVPRKELERFLSEVGK